MRRARLIGLAVLVLAGCGDEPPPDAATSERLVTRAVLDYHRHLADSNGKAGCALLTERARRSVVAEVERMSSILGREPATDCAGAIGQPVPPTVRDGWRRTRVDAVRLRGDRATAVVHTTVPTVSDRPTPAVALPLRWHDGRWRVDAAR